jgi:hypothetical protein
LHDLGRCDESARAPGVLAGGPARAWEGLSLGDAQLIEQTAQTADELSAVLRFEIITVQTGAGECNLFIQHRDSFINR